MDSTPSAEVLNYWDLKEQRSLGARQNNLPALFSGHCSFQLVFPVSTTGVFPTQQSSVLLLHAPLLRLSSKSLFLI